MNNLEFVFMVQKMRSLQKTYFKTRDKDVLLQSKDAERKVDSCINEMLKGIPLFNAEDEKNEQTTAESN